MIRVESAEGKGSVFTVEIPVTADERTCDNQTRENAAKMTILRDGAVADADQETVRSSSDITLSGDRETILVIDDNKDVRDYIRSLLEDKYNVLEAADGKDGIRLAMKVSSTQGHSMPARPLRTERTGTSGDGALTARDRTTPM